MFSVNSWRAELAKVERREFAVEAVAARDGFEGGVDLIPAAEAGAFHAAAELGVVEFADAQMADSAVTHLLNANCAAALSNRREVGRIEM